MADQRNFRSSYLGKVGIKGVEEKKSLEILLGEQPYDLNKLLQFCLRFPVPATHRLELWKVLLGDYFHFHLSTHRPLIPLALTLSDIHGTDSTVPVSVAP